MKNIFVLVFIGISLQTFSQKSDNAYTLLDFYKDNWAKDSQTGKYYLKHDIDSFTIVNKTFKSGIDNMYGLSKEEVQKIFGEPTKIMNRCANDDIKKQGIDYHYFFSKKLGEESIGGMYFLFDCKTDKTTYFATYPRMSKEY